MKWRCYICGEPVGKRFILFSLNEETDRVFLGHEACKNRMMDKPIVVIVEVLIPSDK